MSDWTPVTVILESMRTRTESNTGGHWAAKHRRAKLQRSTTFRWLRHLLPASPPPLPLLVTLCRIAPRPLDSHDNLSSAFKHIVDGVSDYLAGAYGTGQDRQEGLLWQYEEKRSKPGAYAVHITLTPLKTDGDSEGSPDVSCP